MPALIIFLALVILIAAFGFWNTLKGIFGSLALIVLIAAALAAVVWFGGKALLRRMRDRV
jgi:hypothetical protein